MSDSEPCQRCLRPVDWSADGWTTPSMCIRCLTVLQRTERLIGHWPMQAFGALQDKTAREIRDKLGPRHAPTRGSGKRSPRVWRYDGTPLENPGL